MSLAQEKARLRLELKKKFKLVQADSSYEQKRQSLLRNLEQWLAGHTGIWATYAALDSELDLQELTVRCRHLDFVYPKAEEGRLRFYQLGPLGFEKGSFGIQEPAIKGARDWDPDKIAGFLVPGLGFTPQGARLGKGKGFYDQALERVSGLKVGVTLQEMLETTLPEEIQRDLGRDVRMDFIATDKAVQSVTEEL